MNGPHRQHVRCDSARRRRGVARADLIVAAGCTLVACATVVPVLGCVATDAGEARSRSNLQLLASANASYAATYGDRQFTAVPEDAGLVGGSCTNYLATIACPPQLLLGLAPNGGWYGFFLGTTGLCSSEYWPGNCSNWRFYRPIDFAQGQPIAGSYLLPNCHGFNAFVDSRFYSDTFYSPNDRAAYAISAPYRDQVLDFDSIGGEGAYSSYCFSPAAMWHPDVFADAYGGYRNPNTFTEGYISPAVSQCTHPDLKTRMVERCWNVGSPSVGPSTAPSWPDGWAFNASSLAAPQTLFFDGHVTRLRNADAIADDEALFESAGLRLWSRTTPFGESGYQPTHALESIRTSHTILTANGIHGRDLLTAH